MADPAEEVQTTEDSTEAAAATQEPTTEPQAQTYTQADIDRAVTKAIKTRENNLKAEKEAALKAAEQKALEEKGEFDTLRKQWQAELDALRRENKLKSLETVLSAEALSEGIRDLADLALVSREDLESAIGEDGAVDRAAVQKAIGELKTSKPYLFNTNDPDTQPKHKGGPTPGSATPEPAGTFEMGAEAVIRRRTERLALLQQPPRPSGVPAWLGKLLPSK